MDIFLDILLKPPQPLMGLFLAKNSPIISIQNQSDFSLVSILNNFIKMYSNTINIVHSNFRRKEPL